MRLPLGTILVLGGLVRVGEKRGIFWYERRQEREAILYNLLLDADKLSRCRRKRALHLFAQGAKLGLEFGQSARLGCAARPAVL